MTTTDSLKIDKKLARMTDRMIYQSIKDKRYPQALKAMEVKLKFEQQAEKSKARLDPLMYMSIKDFPLETLERWLVELQAEAAELGVLDVAANQIVAKEHWAIRKQSRTITPP